MAIEPAYQVDRNDDEIIVRFPQSAVNEARVAQFVAYLERASIRDRSQLSVDADEQDGFAVES